MTNEEIIRLTLEVKGDDGLRDLARDATEAAGKLKQTGEAADKASKSSANLGQSLLQGGRAIQDFAQGGLGGILNNIEGIAAALGLGAGVAGAATVAGVAFAVAGPPILNFLKSLGASEKDIKPIAERINGVAEALKGLAEKTKLSNAETAEYIRLAQESGKLDKEAAANKERLAAMAAQPQGAAKDRTLGEKVTGVVAGKQGSIVAAAAGRLSGLDDFTARNGARLASLQKAEFLTGPQQAELEFLQGQQAELAGKGNAEAQDLLTRAMSGDTEAAKRLVAVLPNSPIRDDLVRATMSDRAKDEARFVGAKALDDTLGAGARRIGERNANARTQRALEANSLAIDDQMDRAKVDRDAKAEAEAKRADRDAERERERKVRESVALGRAIGRAENARGKNPAMPRMETRPLDEMAGETLAIQQRNMDAISRESQRLMQMHRELQEQGRNLNQNIMNRAR